MEGESEKILRRGKIRYSRVVMIFKHSPLILHLPPFSSFLSRISLAHGSGNARKTKKNADLQTKRRMRQSKRKRNVERRLGAVHLSEGSFPVEMVGFLKSLYNTNGFSFLVHPHPIPKYIIQS